MLPSTQRSPKVPPPPPLPNTLTAADKSRAREALKSCLPDPLRNASFAQVLKDDTSTKRCLAQLLYNLSDPIGPGGDGQI